LWPHALSWRVVWCAQLLLAGCSHLSVRSTRSAVLLTSPASSLISSQWPWLKLDVVFFYYRFAPCFFLHIISVCLLYMCALILDKYIFIIVIFSYRLTLLSLFSDFLCLWWQVLT
jgi:hypothetical protein